MKTAHEFIVRQCALLKVLVHDGLVGLSSPLEELSANLFYSSFLALWNIFSFRRTTFCFPNEHFALEYVDGSVEVLTCVDRILEEGTFVTKHLFEFVEGTLEVSVLVVALVDNESDRFFRFLSATEVVLCAYLYAAVSGEGNDSGVRHMEGCNRTTAEVV